uniref:Uncharacterized protein n=1 Tax=Triticum urartu TaxID=4572 RepID=A0A8R7UYU7_TRIUA
MARTSGILLENTTRDAIVHALPSLPACVRRMFLDFTAMSTTRIAGDCGDLYPRCGLGKDLEASRMPRRAAALRTVQKARECVRHLSPRCLDPPTRPRPRPNGRIVHYKPKTQEQR